MDSQYWESRKSSDCSSSSSSSSSSKFNGDNFASSILRLELSSHASPAVRRGQRRSSRFLEGSLYEMTSSISRLRVTLAHTSGFRMSRANEAQLKEYE